jgi:hypothetical protein
MAKLSRRNAREVVAEYNAVVGMELQEQLLFLLAYLSFVEAQQFAYVMQEFMRPMCSGPGYCHICDNKE